MPYDAPSALVNVIGVCGGSGSGKTTLAYKLCAHFDSNVAVISQDNYYKDRSGLSELELSALNFDHPDSLDSCRLAEDISNLKAGIAVDIPQYCFQTHRRRKETLRVEPSNVVIIEGIVLLHEPAVRRQLDLKVYVDADADLRLLRRIKRDTLERGRSIESIRKQYLDTVRPMFIQFVAPQKTHADYIVDGNSLDGLSLALRELTEQLARIQ